MLFLDMDPQGSAADWRSIAPGLDPAFQVQEIERGDLLRQARGLRQRHDIIIIDCPPQYAPASSAAIRVSDLVLVPVQPSPFDVWSTRAIVELIKARQEATAGEPRGGVCGFQGYLQHRVEAFSRGSLISTESASAVGRHYSASGLCDHGCAGVDGI